MVSLNRFLQGWVSREAHQASRPSGLPHFEASALQPPHPATAQPPPTPHHSHPPATRRPGRWPGSAPGTPPPGAPRSSGTSSPTRWRRMLLLWGLWIQGKNDNQCSGVHPSTKNVWRIWSVSIWCTPFRPDSEHAKGQPMHHATRCFFTCFAGCAWAKSRGSCQSVGFGVAKRSGTRAQRKLAASHTLELGSFAVMLGSGLNFLSGCKLIGT